MRHILDNIGNGNDEKAFQKFFEMYYNKLLSIAIFIVKLKEVAEEIVMDVFLNLWKNRDKLSYINRLDAYLYVTVKNKALEYCSQNDRYRYCEVETLSVDLPPDNNTPENLMMNKELSQVMQKSINNLPERCKLIYLMVKVQGLKYKEVARALSINEGTVNAQMVIATKRIGTALKAYYQLSK